jgi:hypothetical protein
MPIHFRPPIEAFASGTSLMSGYPCYHINKRFEHTEGLTNLEDLQGIPSNILLVSSLDTV